MDQYFQLSDFFYISVKGKVKRGIKQKLKLHCGKHKHSWEKVTSTKYKEKYNNKFSLMASIDLSMPVDVVILSYC